MGRWPGEYIYIYIYIYNLRQASPARLPQPAQAARPGRLAQRVRPASARSLRLACPAHMARPAAQSIRPRQQTATLDRSWIPTRQHMMSSTIIIFFTLHFHDKSWLTLASVHQRHPVYIRRTRDGCRHGVALIHVYIYKYMCIFLEFMKYE